MSRSSSPSDDETPESFSFSTSKKTAEGEAKALQKHHADEKQKLKDNRRQRDRVLKERKAQAVKDREIRKETKGKGKAVEGEEQSGGPRSSDELEARMERAMREAQEESDEDGILEGSDEEELASGSGLSEEDEEDSDDDDEVEMQAGSEGESEEEDEDSASLKPPSKKQKLLQNPDYLPEHLFASAFSQNAAAASASSAKSEGKKKRAASALPKKRRRVKQTAKDIVVGSRTIRTLPSSNTQTAAAAPRTLAPPAKVTKFIGRSLNLRGDDKFAKVKGWERRPANVGVMKRNGPAAQFVRS
ncbi:hypothetical protein PHLCEN_2v2355 [Hermanssonia centrifuga]|uniref:Uncharacterized protein n=1 Tax=Hermanssonia centrifuga TaxID=98765 RepID=A0A2R6RM77_9APHY|nr:hypothetical protein PHLCEN_2v2355 [Hermanssonia centrifuga]